MIQKISLTRPDDWHLHVRDGDLLKLVMAHSARQFGRALIMPNLQPPVTCVAHALAYRARILQALPAGHPFAPLMTLYLTDSTTVQDVQQVAEEPCVIGFKLYPAGATTHSDAGVTHIKKIYPLFEAMQSLRVPLLIHAEVVDPEIDIFDRERIFIDRHLGALIEHFPRLKIVFEHITTRDAVQFVMESSSMVAATITPHHLLYNRNALLVGGIRPHYYCLPVLKRETHRQALLQAATSGNPKFFLGTDSAPHVQLAKEAACGCAGCYTAFTALELYAEAFDSVQAIADLEGFASFFGADFYGLPRNREKISLEKTDWQVTDSFTVGNHTLIPLKAGERLSWKCIYSNEKTTD